MKGWGEDFASTLVDYFRTGRLEISKLVGDILADIARLTIRQTITQPLVNALASGLSGFSFGGGTPSAAGAPFQAPAGTGVGLRAPAGGFNVSGAFAKGGNAMAGKSYVVGERGREIFTPAVSGRVTPIAPQAAPVMNLTVNVDARSDVAAVRQAVRESSYVAQAEMARSMRTGAGR
jgi:phage-related minor tail protein